MGLDLIHAVPTSLPGLEYFPVKELEVNPEYIIRHRHLIQEIIDEEGVAEQVIYFEEKGYQRKGMIRAFYEDFINDHPYFDIASVKRAVRYLAPKPEQSKKQAEQYFRENFIDNFIEGESFFFASW